MTMTPMTPFPPYAQNERVDRESTTEQSLGGNAGDWCYLYRAGHRFFKERPDEPS